MYTLKHSTKAKRIRITIHVDGTCIVTAPAAASQDTVHAFVSSKSAWIQRKISEFSTLSVIKRNGSAKGDFKALKEQALELVTKRIQHFNTKYRYTWKNIRIQNNKSMWGSCSRHGNLSFNYKIVLLPPELSDYIIVHELCHLGELNHSKAFWYLVSKEIPEYTKRKKELSKVRVRYQ